MNKSEGGSSPFDYSLDGLVNIIDTTLSAITFDNVSVGQHTITVTDSTGRITSYNVCYTKLLRTVVTNGNF